MVDNVVMIKNSKNFRSHCPINFLLETVGDKWSLLIIRDLMFKGKRSYGDFLTSAEKISTNILADRLQKLEAHELVVKSVDETNRARQIYRLTTKGKDLLPLMLEITLWSARHDSFSNAPQGFLQALQGDRQDTINKILAGLE